MYDNLKLRNYRCFEHYQIEGLSRINLLVGGNNTGKSSILESLKLLTSRSLLSVFQLLRRRGERLFVDEGDREVFSEGDLKHLFFGHRMVVQDDVSIVANDGASRHSLRISIDDRSRLEEHPSSTSEVVRSGEEEIALPAFVSFDWRGPRKLFVESPLSPRGGLDFSTLRYRAPEPSLEPMLITTSSLSIDEVVASLEEVVLTPEEDLVRQALQIIEPSIEAFATFGRDRSRTGLIGERGGVFVRRKGIVDRIPIGSMGDGIWRLLGLAASIARSHNRILLVDEIDTGLHHEVMDKMWRLVIDAARRLNVQVFATTHSLDCFHSLAIVYEKMGEGPRDVSVQRIERGRFRPVSYTPEVMIAAARRGIEVR